MAGPFRARDLLSASVTPGEGRALFPFLDWEAALALRGVARRYARAVAAYDWGALWLGGPGGNAQLGAGGWAATFVGVRRAFPRSAIVVFDRAHLRAAGAPPGCAIWPLALTDIAALDVPGLPPLPEFIVRRVPSHVDRGRGLPALAGARCVDLRGSPIDMIMSDSLASATGAPASSLARATGPLARATGPLVTEADLTAFADRRAAVAPGRPLDLFFDTRGVSAATLARLPLRRLGVYVFGAVVGPELDSGPDSLSARPPSLCFTGEFAPETLEELTLGGHCAVSLSGLLCSGLPQGGSLCSSLCSSLQKLRMLHLYALPACNIGDTALAALVALESLHIYGCGEGVHITDAGIRAQRAASGRALTQLVLHNLPSVAITDAGAAALAGAEMVQLRGCPGVFLTSAALYSLAGATYLAFTGGDFAFTGQGLFAVAGLYLGPPAQTDDDLISQDFSQDFSQDTNQSSIRSIRIQVQRGPLPLRVLQLADAGEFADELDVLQAFGVEVLFDPITEIGNNLGNFDEFDDEFADEFADGFDDEFADGFDNEIEDGGFDGSDEF